VTEGPKGQGRNAPNLPEWSIWLGDRQKETVRTAVAKGSIPNDVTELPQPFSMNRDGRGLDQSMSRSAVELLILRRRPSFVARHQYRDGFGNRVAPADQHVFASLKGSSTRKHDRALRTDAETARLDDPRTLP
jgi:hypothetical protein